MISGLADGATFPIGTTTVTYEVTDAANNSIQCLFDVTVVGVAPQIVCPANIVENNTPGTCGSIVSFNATDIVGIPASTITYSIASGSVFNVGTVSVIATATNAVGSSSCTFDVTVVDNEFPVVICPANIIGVIATSAAGAVVNYTAPVGTDNCTGATTALLSGPASGATFPIGTTTVTYEVTDAANNNVQCSFDVTVVGVAPQIVCPANIVENNTPGTCGSIVSLMLQTL